MLPTRTVVLIESSETSGEIETCSVFSPSVFLDMEFESKD